MPRAATAALQPDRLNQYLRINAKLDSQPLRLRGLTARTVRLHPESQFPARRRCSTVPVEAL